MHTNSRVNKSVKPLSYNSTPRPNSPRVEIEKHFTINKRNASSMNQGVETFPYVGLENEFIEHKPKLKVNNSKSRSDELNLDLNNFSLDAGLDECTALNKKVLEINKQLADLENDIQTNFYDSDKFLNFYAMKNPTNTPVSKSFSNISNKNAILKTKYDRKVEIRKMPDARILYDTFFDKKSMKSDAASELKSEISNYRQTIHNELRDEKMERKIQQLRAEKLTERSTSIVDLFQGNVPSLANVSKMEKRGANFTKSEINTLVDIALKYKDIIENKRTDGTTSQDKNKAWDLIASEFNGASGNFSRTSKTIRNKYDAIKKDLRKKCSNLRLEQLKTGGGLSDHKDFSSYEEKILAACQISMVGLSSKFDDDGAQSEESLTTRPNNSIEFLDADREECAIYLHSVNEAHESINDGYPSCSEPKLPVQLYNEEASCELIVENASYSTPSTNSRKRQASSSFEKYPFKENRKRKTSERRNDRSEVTGEVIDLKKKLLKLQIESVQKEMDDKAKIAALTIENLLLDQEIKKAKLKNLQ